MLPEKACPVNTCPLVVVPSSSLSCHQTIWGSVQTQCNQNGFFFCFVFLLPVLHLYGSILGQLCDSSTLIMQQQHIMQQHSHYATALSAKHVTAAYHAMQHSQSCNGSILCSSTVIMQQQHIMQWHSHYVTATMQHSQSCNGSISYSSILNAIALSHYEF